MKLTPQMKLEVVNYLLQFSKGLIEDNESCPTLAEAFTNGKLKLLDIETFIEEFREEANRILAGQ